MDKYSNDNMESLWKQGSNGYNILEQVKGIKLNGLEQNQVTINQLNRVIRNITIEQNYIKETKYKILHITNGREK